jgi:hypothetical protein
VTPPGGQTGSGASGSTATLAKVKHDGGQKLAARTVVTIVVSTGGATKSFHYTIRIGKLPKTALA